MIIVHLFTGRLVLNQCRYIKPVSKAQVAVGKKNNHIPLVKVISE